MKLLALLALLPTVAFAAPVPIDVVVVNMPQAEAQNVLALSLALLPPNLVRVSGMTEMPHFSGVYADPLKRWRKALCETRGEPGRINLVLDRRIGVNGMADICVTERRCTVAYVAINPDQLLASIIAVAHELLHALGALHIAGCNLMNKLAIHCGGTRVIPKTLQQVRECLR